MMPCWLVALWHWRLRAIDLKILWPQCKALTPDIDLAKAVFATHAFADPAWISLGKDEVIRRIDALR